jgi:hypothetical protein|mmetsp:Transcript_16990/g.52675  ORF Transcript_16990/g.52675 Transcript_16990/m.52675 type:complete len:90 (-) Transcript_16990:159-428(-)
MRWAPFGLRFNEQAQRIAELSFGFGTRESLAAWGVAAAALGAWYGLPEIERRRRHALAKERTAKLLTDKEAQAEAMRPDASHVAARRGN